MADSTRYAEWYAKAGTELESAEILFEHGGSYAVIAFLCQQTIEKALKGFVLQHDEVLLDGHSLIYLCKRTAEIDMSYRKFLKDCAYVNQFYLETRYPADIPMNISKDEAQECLLIANALLDKVVAGHG